MIKTIAQLKTVVSTLGLDIHERGHCHVVFCLDRSVANGLWLLIHWSLQAAMFPDNTVRIPMR